MTTNGSDCLPSIVFSSVVDPQGCWNVVWIELEQQLWTHESSLENCQEPVSVELELVVDENRCEDGGVWRYWLDELRRCVDDWQLKRDEDLVQGSKLRGWECPREMPLWVRMKRMEEEQRYEGSSGLGVNAQYGCKGLRD